MDFKKDNSFDKRSQLSSKITDKYPSKVPIIVEVAKQDRKRITLPQNKYLVENSSTLGSFLVELRKNIDISKEEAIFLFCMYDNRDVLIPVSKTVGDIYSNYKDADGFLYFVVALESVFGN